MAVIGLVWLFATATLTYAAGEKLTASRRLVPTGVVRNGVAVPVRRSHPR